jgi:hypothetical protein
MNEIITLSTMTRNNRDIASQDHRLFDNTQNGERALDRVCHFRHKDSRAEAHATFKNAETPEKTGQRENDCRQQVRKPA